MTTIACIGECMIELTQGTGNQLTRGYGGDTLNTAAYLAARLRGAMPVEAAHAGHRLAGAVVGHRGAIIPRAAMPSGLGAGTLTTERLA